MTTTNNFSVKLSELLHRFAQQPLVANAGGVNSIAYQNLISVLNSSPAYLSYISDAVNSAKGVSIGLFLKLNVQKFNTMPEIFGA